MVLLENPYDNIEDDRVPHDEVEHDKRMEEGRGRHTPYDVYGFYDVYDVYTHTLWSHTDTYTHTSDIQTEVICNHDNYIVHT